MPIGESLSDISMRLTTAEGHTTGTVADRQRSYLVARCTTEGFATTGSVADLQNRLGLPVREILREEDIT